MKYDLTACLVIFNEEKVIERCLKSLQEVTNNILIVHDGKCSDNSLKICQKYKAKIFIRPHQGEAEPHRAWLYAKVKTDWILQLDADEYLSPQLQKEIPQLIKDENISAYEFLWLYWDGERYRTKSWPWRKALFRKDKIKYLAFPHEEVRVSGLTKRLPLQLEHKPTYHNLTIKMFRTKWLNWIRIHARYLVTKKQQYQTFPANIKLKPHYTYLTKNPLLYAFPLFMYHFAGLYLYGGGIKEGFYGLKACLFMSAYYFLLSIEVYKLQHEKIN